MTGAPLPGGGAPSFVRLAVRRAIDGKFTVRGKSPQPLSHFVQNGIEAQMTRNAAPRRLPVSDARERLADIVMRVQDPREHCVLTRHGKPVAAVVSIASLHSIIDIRDQDARVAEGWIPNGLRLDRKEKKEKARYLSWGEAAVQLREVQLDRLAERRLLARAGMEPIPGGELEVSAVEVVEIGRKRWWRFWFSRK